MNVRSRRVARVLVVGWLVGRLGASGPDAAEPSSGPVAKVVSFQNKVETKHATETAWTVPTMQQPLFPNDRVRTGPASRAAILYSDQTLHRLNEKSEVEIQPPTPEKAGLLKVLSGTHFFSSRQPKDYGRVETPAVTAAIKGTEFVVEVGAEGATTITMLEGTVEASNEQGSVTVGSGEAAVAERGKAPQKRVVVRPRDAVAWSLYYPPVLGGADVKRLRSMGEQGKSLATAAELLASGQVSQAKPLIESARSAKPDDPVALALASVIEIAENRKDEATKLADRAVAADPSSPAAALASSFAAQASFDIARARQMAEKAAELDPGSSVASARAAELRMAEGDIDGARKAAEAAVQRTPNDARALAVLGFVELAEYRSSRAEQLFERAVAADPALSLAHLGLGIATIRGGRVDKGREELQTAVALDPENALTRSYLGKAYYEERRSKEASKEFAAAKQADPQDPTPYLYDAITKQNENRPVEALSDLQESIERNDRRAVYRSRLLLDQDRAVRAADVARIYNDLGFEQLGLVSARRSADENQANFSSHLLLSGNYRTTPQYAPAFLSEVLQSRIYQPVGANAARPDVIGEGVSFNEYTALFDRPRARAFGTFVYGMTETDPTRYWSPDEIVVFPDGSLRPATDQGIPRSRTGLADVVGTYHTDRFSMALELRRQYDSGFRQNSDTAANVYRGFFQYAPSWRDSVQLNVIYGEDKKGGLPLRETPLTINWATFETQLTNVGVGYHRILSPNNDLAVSAIYSEATQDGSNIYFPTNGGATLKGPQLEVQDVWRLKAMTWIFGVGAFDGTTELTSGQNFGIPIAAIDAPDRFFNGYAYGKFRGLGPVELTAGAAIEHVTAPVGFLPPRDSNILPGDTPVEKTEVSPKLGMSVYFKSKTTLRAAAFYRLSPALGRLQTLEPTQVAGFNQFFDDPGGTKSFSYGVGFDQEIVKRLFFGGSYLRRDRSIPEPYCGDGVWNPFSACAFQPATTTWDKESHDDVASAYLNATLGARVTAGLEYTWYKSRWDFTQVTPTGLFEDYSRTETLTPQVRFFLPVGLFGIASATNYKQRVDQFGDWSVPDRQPVSADFWTVDAQLGWRLPNRYGSIVLEGKNLSDRRFDFYLQPLERQIIPARQLALRAVLTY